MQLAFGLNTQDDRFLYGTEDGQETWDCEISCYQLNGCNVSPEFLGLTAGKAEGPMEGRGQMRWLIFIWETVRDDQASSTGSERAIKV